MISAAEESRGEKDASHGRKGYGFYALVTLLLLHDGKHLTWSRYLRKKRGKARGPLGRIVWAKVMAGAKAQWWRIPGTSVEQSDGPCRGCRRRVTRLEGLHSVLERGRGGL